MLKPAVLLFLSLAAGLARAEPISYSDDVEPILTHKCVACHTCYDAPCQLNLGSGEGILRGASKQLVYDGTRTKAQATTRLYLDAQGEEAWEGIGTKPGLLVWRVEDFKIQPWPEERYGACMCLHWP